MAISWQLAKKKKKKKGYCLQSRFAFDKKFYFTRLQNTKFDVCKDIYIHLY